MTNTSKAEETRDRILSAAIELFRHKGFDQTTMREIAQAAGVALGSAYYYFDSKEALVLEFYDRASNEMHPRIEESLTRAKGLETQLQVILQAKFDYFGPNRLFLGALFGHAADPQNPLSPFSGQTRHIRDRDIAHFEKALDSSASAIPKDLAPHLPRLLWFYQMGLILFWIYDRSPDQIRTRQLLDKSLQLVIASLKMVGFPLLRPLRKKVVDLIQVVAGDESEA